MELLDSFLTGSPSSVGGDSISGDTSVSPRPESVDTLDSSGEFCSWFDAGEALKQGRSLTEDEVLA